MDLGSGDVAPFVLNICRGMKWRLNNAAMTGAHGVPISVVHQEGSEHVKSELKKVGFAQKVESHQRQLVDHSSPTYKAHNNIMESHQQQLVDCSDPA